MRLLRAFSADKMSAEKGRKNETQGPNGPEINGVSGKITPTIEGRVLVATGTVTNEQQG